MANRIILCGVNGSGKTTLGRALAARTGWTFRDAEDYFFPQGADPALTAPRPKAEAAALLLADLQAHENWIFASVRGDYGEAVSALYTCAVYVSVPQPIRAQRVWRRSYEKHGSRILPGGDLYASEQRFFDMVNARTERHVTDFLDTLSVPVLAVDGTLPTRHNVERIIQALAGLRSPLPSDHRPSDPHSYS